MGRLAPTPGLGRDIAAGLGRDIAAGLGRDIPPGIPPGIPPPRFIDGRAPLIPPA
ncbi:MAG: hypothetical protein ACK557_21925 [Planctomycetota bacterium]